MVALSAFLGIDFIRSDQKNDILPVPYFSYKMTTANQESAHQDIREVEENQTDPTSADVILYEKVEEIISLNFYDKNRVDREITYAEKALRWFKSIDGRELCKDNGITPRMIDTVVQDRSIFQEMAWENRLGFDIRFDYSGKYIQTIEAVETVEVTPTIDGEQKEKIIY
jgi:hypothetical protein